jgi:MtN3 and saliva related transmembrane protein
MNYSYIVGLFAGTNTTICFLPQVVKIYTHKSVKDISVTMYMVYLTGALSWIVYGYMVVDYIIILFNSISCLLLMGVFYGIYRFSQPTLSSSDVSME